MSAQSDSPHAQAEVVETGPPLASAETAVLLLHGRGASAFDILGLGGELGFSDAAFLAPQAVGHTWYPNSFLAPIPNNEPWLSSAISLIASLVQRCVDAGISSERIVLVGFSQGACLASEFVARHPRRYAAVLAFTGGLIGPPGFDLHHDGSLAQTPILLSSGDPDPHVPWSRVEQTAAQFTAMDAAVKLRRYPGRPHTILAEELKTARTLLRAAHV